MLSHSHVADDQNLGVQLNLWEDWSRKPFWEKDYSKSEVLHHTAEPTFKKLVSELFISLKIIQPFQNSHWTKVFPFDSQTHRIQFSILALKIHSKPNSTTQNIIWNEREKQTNRLTHNERFSFKKAQRIEIIGSPQPGFPNSKVFPKSWWELILTYLVITIIRWRKRQKSYPY
jgi:hypothetical protein